MMPLDTHLNQDAHECVRYHTAATKHIKDENDPRKFSMSIPARGLSAYLRIWDPKLGPDAGCPRQDRIKEDIYRIVRGAACTVMQIFWACGAALKRETGRRRCDEPSVNAEQQNWGGKCTKVPYADRPCNWVHDIAASEIVARQEKYREMEQKFGKAAGKESSK